jgi:hypothetical protein
MVQADAGLDATAVFREQMLDFGHLFGPIRNMNAVDNMGLVHFWSPYRVADILSESQAS